MVKCESAALDRTFAALADPTRRALVQRLGQQQSLTVGELARPYPVTLPAIMKHLDVLAAAGLIVRSKAGRTVSCQLTAGPMEQAMNWLNRYQRFRSAQLATKPSLTLRRRIKAPPAKVYAAWTDPAQLTRWFGPDAGPVLHAESDTRVGSRFRVQFQLLNGELCDVAGVYREVVPDERLVFTWAWRSTRERESLVTVALKSEGDGTDLTLIHEQFFDRAARDGHRGGWNTSLDKLERLFD